MLIASIVIITAALVFYSIGVIGEARRKMLMWKDVGWFAAGLASDATGTFLMSRMASSGERHLSPLASQMMTISGTLAIALMAIHIVFAVVLLKRDTYREKFHKWSLAIWAVWLVSYAIGPIGLMM